MKNIYFTYRQVFTDRGVKQDVSFYNDKIFEDFKSAGLTKMIDGERFIPESRIIEEIAPGVKTLRKAGVLSVSDIFTTEQVEKFKSDLLYTSQSFLSRIKTTDEMKEWIRKNTNLEEIEDGKFLKNKADGIDILEDEYLIIE